MQIGVRRLSSLASKTSRPWQQLSLQHPKPLSQESDSGVAFQLAFPGFRSFCRPAFGFNHTSLTSVAPSISGLNCGSSLKLKTPPKHNQLIFLSVFFMNSILFMEIHILKLRNSSKIPFLLTRETKHYVN